MLEKTPIEVNAFLSNPTEYASTMRNTDDAQVGDNLNVFSNALRGESQFRMKTKID